MNIITVDCSLLGPSVGVFNRESGKLKTFYFDLERKNTAFKLSSFVKQVLLTDPAPLNSDPLQQKKFLEETDSIVFTPLFHGKAVHTADTFLVSRGPGSFTGIRIALSFLYGFCQKNDFNLVGSLALDSLVWHLAIKSGTGCFFIHPNTQTHSFVSFCEKNQPPKTELKTNEEAKELFSNSKSLVYCFEGFQKNYESFQSSSAPWCFLSPFDFLSQCHLGMAEHYLKYESLYDLSKAPDPYYLRLSTAQEKKGEQNNVNRVQ